MLFLIKKILTVIKSMYHKTYILNHFLVYSSVMLHCCYFLKTYIAW